MIDEAFIELRNMMRHACRYYRGAHPEEVARMEGMLQNIATEYENACNNAQMWSSLMQVVMSKLDVKELLLDESAMRKLKDDFPDGCTIIAEDVRANVMQLRLLSHDDANDVLGVSHENVRRVDPRG